MARRNQDPIFGMVREVVRAAATSGLTSWVAHLLTYVAFPTVRLGVLLCRWPPEPSLPYLMRGRLTRIMAPGYTTMSLP